jgi:amidase
MDELLFAPATALARALRARELSAVELVEALLARIETVDPQINAVVQIAPDARAQARQADADLAQGIVRGPLHGLPFTVKDVFATVGFATPLDQRLRRRAAPSVDAVAVARLRQAGAILLAKTNCPPNGSGSDTENALHGRTFHPAAPAHTPGGSSGGEAALIVAGGSPFGLGSDSKGGIRVPAHYCGVAALKPTAGRVPNTGAYNQPGGLTDPRTQIGPLARTVDDLALVLPLIAGVDDADSGVVPMPWRNPAAVRLTSLRLAYFAEDPASPVTHETAQAVGAAAQALARAGVQVTAARPRDLVETARQIDDAWDVRAGSPGKTVVELFALWDEYRSHLLRFMADYDALLCPVDHHPAPPFRERDPRRFDYTLPFSLSGYPCVVVRVGTAPGGLPIGVQMAARPWREDVALVLARCLEQELGKK